MKCREFRVQAEEIFAGSGIDLSQAMQEHLNSCSDCRQYINQLENLRSLLNAEKLEIRANELDDINFENIIQKAGEVKIKSESWAARSYGPMKIWVPVAAAALILLALFIPYISGVLENKTDFGLYNYYSDASDVEDQVYSSESLSGMLLMTLETDDEELAQASDELEQNLDIEELINLMSDEELEKLFTSLEQNYGREG